MNYTQADMNKLLKILPTSKATAIHAYDIAQSLGYPVVGNQVETRGLIRFAIQSGHLILKSRYWISNNKNEIREYMSSLQSRARDTQQRSDELKGSWNLLNPNNQI